MSTLNVLSGALKFAILFYIGIGFLISVHGFNVPNSAFTIGAVITMFVLGVVMIINYKL